MKKTKLCHWEGKVFIHVLDCHCDDDYEQARDLKEMEIAQYEETD